VAANPSVPEPALKLDTQRNPTETIVHCTGKITGETAPLLQETVRALIPAAKCIVVDLEHVAYIDSAGLGALVGVWSSARKKSAEVGFRWPEPSGSQAPYELKLVNFNDYVRKLLRITRLDKVFGVPDEAPRHEP
jgi:anti-sigma B factor antagonist